MGKLLCEKNLRDVWCRNESVRAEIGQILNTHRHTDTRGNLSSIDIYIALYKGYCCFIMFIFYLVSSVLSIRKISIKTFDCSV